MTYTDDYFNSVSAKTDVLTVAEPVRFKASGGTALILNPVTMTVLKNDVAGDTWVELDPGTQVMLTGMFNDDVYLIVVNEEAGERGAEDEDDDTLPQAGDFSVEEATYGLVLRRASWQNLLAASVSS